MRRDLVTRRGATYATRSLHGVLAHELTHAALERHLGTWAYVRLPSWKDEGYADYVADESSFPIERAAELLRRGASDPSPAFRYAVDRLMVAYLLDGRRIAPAAMLRTALDAERVREGAREWVR